MYDDCLAKLTFDLQDAFSYMGPPKSAAEVHLILSLKKKKQCKWIMDHILRYLIDVSCVTLGNSVPSSKRDFVV